ncbi:hypothetical protein ElyMa_001527300 [Elysia marginata]|uniref:Phorbol-ester/DAG-type domain-containing protein n=1 Tax=Elysia marginata TaxID=1093978 RepID=A0AAV4JAW7_9GAST|nr:hypothetical protein ElyMa_001527300 [Elysia marginata]
MAGINSAPHVTSPKRNTSRLQVGGGHVCLLHLLLAAMLVATAGSNSVYPRSPPPPCVPCDTQAIPDVVFARRYLGTCMACGEMYGTGIAHCCMCYESFTKQCNTALKRR